MCFFPNDITHDQISIEVDELRYYYNSRSYYYQSQNIS